jgi:hypothetical protein
MSCPSYSKNGMAHLLLQSADGTASISIGSNSYSYVYIKDGKVNTGESVRFTPSAVLKTLRMIAA